MAAVSLNLQQKVHPVIWSVSNLPFDCVRAVPIKKPIGGTLILSVNALIYLNQSIPPYGVSLNSLPDTCSNIPLSKFIIFKLPQFLFVKITVYTNLNLCLNENLTNLLFDQATSVKIKPLLVV